MMYAVKFRKDAEKEWKKLEKTIQSQFAKQLIKRYKNPHVSSEKLRNMQNCDKIKLRTSGFRLVYQVIDDVLIIVVVAVGKREKSQFYNLASERLK
ncbi:type II toxin-antitoxin system RelE/ParE family toxin [Salmonella enterica subsp. enterica]|nr:type II toxin-antitoxin system RelE/ParE family toxin [Salmonella enterica subsp. enterica]